MVKRRHVSINTNKYRGNSQLTASRHETLANRTAMDINTQSLIDKSYDEDTDLFCYDDNDEEIMEHNDDDSCHSNEHHAINGAVNPPLFQELMQIGQEQADESDNEYDYHIDSQSKNDIGHRPH